MKFSYSWIKEFTKTNLSPQDAAELLSSKSFEVEDTTSTNEDPDEIDITIEDKNLCSRYSALIIRGVTVGQSPQWLRERLESLGLKSINNIVDATNYIMLQTGQPLHAFDLAKLNGIVVRKAKEGESIKTLDEEQTEYELNDSILVIADKTKPIAIAGIKGGTDTAISGSTKDILVESANFAPEIVRKGSRELQIRTDASIRFSYGVDSNLTVPALVQTAEMISKVASGKADERVLDLYPKRKQKIEINLETDYTRELLGEEIEDKKIIQILENLGFIVSGSGDLLVKVPTWRLDVKSQEDLIEEVGRVYGYENIKSKPPVVTLFDEKAWTKDDTDVIWDNYEFICERNFISHLLASVGFSEVYNYSFVSDEIKKSLLLNEMIEIKSPISQEQKYLRRSLIPRMIMNAKDNLRFDNKVRIFETGRVFVSTEKDEERRLAILFAKKGDNENIFFAIKSVADLLMHKIGIMNHWYDDTAPFMEQEFKKLCANGRFAEIKTGDNCVLGALGVLNKEFSDRFKIKGDVAIAEFRLKRLIECFQKEREFEPLPKYPSVVRDISILVKPEIKVGDVLNTIKTADMERIVRDVDIFDIYEPAPSEHPRHPGEEPRRKSIAFHVLYRSDDHTLTDSEVTKVEDGIKNAMQEKLDAEIR
jgi:phenylalanyl-tRNA synthetase beta chain